MSISTNTLLVVGIPSATLVLFVFFRAILDNEKWINKIFLLLYLLAIIGILSTIFNHSNVKYIFFIYPLISISIYRLFYHTFYAKFKRWPIDTSLHWNKAITGWDRAFNIGYILFGFIFPFVIVIYIEKFIKLII